MRIGVPREAVSHERRVALVPPTVARLVKAGHDLIIEEGAGLAASFPDEAYRDAGARVGSRAEALGAEIVLQVQAPPEGEVAALASGAVLAALLQPSTSADLLQALAARGVSSFAMELVPRTTKAQAMDVLSSQATVAGYAAVLLAASRLDKLLPMLVTAAGTLPPAKAFIVGAGVAGLQAIATTRRLGAIVSAFDVRPIVKEQVMSLGATFLDVEAVGAEGTGGYAKELAEDQQLRVREAIGRHVRDMDLVITTAQIPGRPAPRILTADMVRSMRPGSVIVDLAAESGGNCELTRFGEEVVESGVRVIGPANLPSAHAHHASLMYSRNLQTFLDFLLQDGAVKIDLDDSTLGPMCVTHAGAVRTGS